MVFEAFSSAFANSFPKELEAIDSKLDLSELLGKFIETLKYEGLLFISLSLDSVFHQFKFLTFDLFVQC